MEAQWRHGYARVDVQYASAPTPSPVLSVWLERGPVAERQVKSICSIGFSGLKPRDAIHILRAASFTEFGETDASVTSARLSAVRR
jgi:hypothetical protein